MKLIFWVLLSVLLNISGIALISLWPLMLDALLLLRKNSLIYQYWQTIPVDLPFDIYFFNWTNSEDVYNMSVKPKFEEVGPYRFWQKEEKKNIVWNDNGTVTFEQVNFYYYNTQTTNRNLSDRIVSINPIALGSANLLRNWNYYIKKGIFVTLAPFFHGISITKTVRELYFDGFPEPLIKLSAAVPLFAQYKIPQWDRFGWGYQKNGSTELTGTFNMGTGINSKFSEVYSWNHYTRTPFYDGTCGEVYGSTGEFFARNLTRDWLTFFSIDLRRRITLKFEKEETFNNIRGYKYVAEGYALDNGTLYQENRCYCGGECLPSGVLNLTSTRSGMPIYMSLPHFYQADPYYNNLIEGLNPDSEKHGLTVTVEPTTGIPIKVRFRVQANMLVRPISGIPIFEKAPKFMVPVVWMSQTFEIRGIHAFLVKLLSNTQIICTSIGAVLIVAGMAIVGFTLYGGYWENLKEAKQKFVFFAHS